MAKEINEETGFVLSIKTLIGIAFAIATVVGMWFALQADIQEAKELPVPPPPTITRMEFDMKDQLVRQTIMDTQKDVEEIKKTLEKIEDKLYGR
jgi:hypothetical protein